jgi:hypothetical protein
MKNNKNNKNKKNNKAKLRPALHVVPTQVKINQHYIYHSKVQRNKWAEKMRQCVILYTSFNQAYQSSARNFVFTLSRNFSMHMTANQWRNYAYLATSQPYFCNLENVCQYWAMSPILQNNDV